MPKEVSPEHLAIEQDIAAISADLKARRGGQARKNAEQGISKEDMKSAVSTRIESSPAPGASSSSQSSASTLPSYTQNAPEEVRLKIEKLIDLAWHKGIWRAVQEAKNSDPLTLDALHDALTDKIYEEFKKRGLL
ncbi:MAG: Uncharacterized protein G01um10143_467 [Parcubacteria group bacterium Gr01-1014_3]|nr:MAG: Uncharacterized protein G01um10143_467 [Parcubacteria group bacterium Gr01-1014_3]